jgi:hypothetical protein
MPDSDDQRELSELANYLVDLVRKARAKEKEGEAA